MLSCRKGSLLGWVVLLLLFHSRFHSAVGPPTEPKNITFKVKWIDATIEGTHLEEKLVMSLEFTISTIPSGLLTLNRIEEAIFARLAEDDNLPLPPTLEAPKERYWQVKVGKSFVKTAERGTHTITPLSVQSIAAAEVNSVEANFIVEKQLFVKRANSLHDIVAVSVSANEDNDALSSIRQQLTTKQNTTQKVFITDHEECCYALVPTVTGWSYQMLNDLSIKYLLGATQTSMTTIYVVPRPPQVKDEYTSTASTPAS